MAQSIKFGSDTYLDASDVMMNSSNSTYRMPLSEWGDGLRGTQGLSIANGGTLNLTLANDTRAFLVTNGAAQSGKRIIIISVTGSGAVSYNCIPDVPSQLTITTGTNSLSIANNTSAAMQITAFIRQGSIA